LLEQGRTGSWPSVFRSAALAPDFWVYRKKPLEELLPWDFIGFTTTRSTLLRERRKIEPFLDREKGVDNG